MTQVNGNDSVLECVRQLFVNVIVADCVRHDDLKAIITQQGKEALCPVAPVRTIRPPGLRVYVDAGQFARERRVTETIAHGVDGHMLHQNAHKGIAIRARVAIAGEEEDVAGPGLVLADLVISGKIAWSRFNRKIRVHHSGHYIVSPKSI